MPETVNTEGYNGAYTGQQIDDGIAKANGALQKSGGVMTGELTLAGDPSEDNHAANKKYVDDADYGTWGE